MPITPLSCRSIEKKLGDKEDLARMAQRDADLSKLSMQDLLALQDRIALEVHARRQADERALRLRGGLIERDGPRYRNPANSAETWSGKGLRPGWVDRVLSQGLALADLEILDDRPQSGDRGSEGRGPR